MTLTAQTIRDQMQAQMWGQLAEDLARQEQIELLERRERIEEAWKAYAGKHPDSVRKTSGQADYNIAINYARTIVDKGVSFLFGQDGGVDIQIDQDSTPTDQDDASESPAAAFLSSFWGDDKSYRRGRKTMSKEIRLQKLAMDGAICGHVFCKLQPDPDDPSAPPLLIALDPQNMVVTTHPDNIDQVEEYNYTWITTDENMKAVVRRQRCVADDSGESWMIYDEEAYNVDWRLRDTGEPNPATWPYPWPPIHECQNLPMPNQQWGVSDLERDVLDLNYAINGSVTDCRKILSLFASPTPFGKMLGNRGVSEWGPGKMILGENPESDLSFLEMASDGQFALTFLDRLVDALHETTEIPAVATGTLQNTGGPLSGAALAILYGPLVDKTEKKRGTYGDMIEELSVHALQLGGYEGLDVNLVWPDMIPQDAQGQAALIATKQRVGVSNSTLMSELGHDPEVEMDQKNQERRDAQAAFDAGVVPNPDMHQTSDDPDYSGEQYNG